MKYNPGDECNKATEEHFLNHVREWFSRKHHPPIEGRAGLQAAAYLACDNLQDAFFFNLVGPAAKVESPIERWFLYAFVSEASARYDILYRLDGKLYGVVSVPEDNTVIIEPQATIGNHRVDFLIEMRDHSETVESSKVIVECDGHDFHERTREQATRDKTRDRELQSAGLPVLRFTGTEIYKSAMACAEEVQKYLWRSIYRKREGDQALIDLDARIESVQV